MMQNAVVQQLRQGGVRVTPQRLAIAEAVLNSSDHPTVQQIHERVQQHFPSMTLATVYSTLGVLSRSGLIQELPFAKQSRYESNVLPHVTPGLCRVRQHHRRRRRQRDNRSPSGAGSQRNGLSGDVAAD